MSYTLWGVGADPNTLDCAVRAFRRDNPMRWPCTCIVCICTIRWNYRVLTDEGRAVLEQEGGE